MSGIQDYRAPIGIFNERSWRFWHLRLDCRPIPSLPTRPPPSAT